MAAVEMAGLLLSLLGAAGNAAAGHMPMAMVASFGAGLWFSDLTRRFFCWLAAR